jgi:lipid II:glycine glycyltransferase (peptidoglycan interpeptide bridge formation enzyme)
MAALSATTVRTITPDEHLAFVAARGSASFLQVPSWGRVKKEWRSESIGWHDSDGKIVGAGLVLYRQIPKIQRYLAYLPEGPAVAFEDVTDAAGLRALLDPMLAHLKSKGAFGVRMGPMVVTRRWSSETIKAAVKDGQATKLQALTPDSVDPAAQRIGELLRAEGWIPPSTAAGFAAGQPQYVFQVPLAGRSREDLLAGFNQQWRRNIKKAEKAGVEVTVGGPGDLAEFHALYAVTAERDHFTPRPLTYFQTMMGALQAEDPERFTLYLARHEGELLAATIWIRVGTHAWYSYGASANHKRELQPSNAIQWRMMSDAHAAGAAVYDLRGITDTLDPADPHFGLIQFKLGTGGQAVEYLGEWDLPINKVLFKAFQLYLAKRG